MARARELHRRSQNGEKLSADGQRVGVLLSHGFTGAPASMIPWGQALAEQGFYKDAGLDVEIVEGGTDIVPQTQLAQGQADYAIAWVPKALQSREQGAGITDVGQVFQRSGTLQVAFKDANITTAADLDGKKVGNWGFGNEFELFAGMTKAGLDPGKDVTLVQQQFDMQALLKKEIDAAQAMSLALWARGRISADEGQTEWRQRL